METPHVVLVSLLLTLSIFQTLFRTSPQILKSSHNSAHGSKYPDLNFGWGKILQTLDFLHDFY